jgi:hypothetical protein
VVAHQPVALGATTDAVGLRLLDARGVRLHPDAQCEAEIEAFLVREPELLGELVDSGLCCQVVSDQPFVFLLGAIRAGDGANRGPLSSRRPLYRHEHTLRWVTLCVLSAVPMIDHRGETPV